MPPNMGRFDVPQQHPTGGRYLRWGWVFPLAVAWVLVPAVLARLLPRPSDADKTVDGDFYTTPRGLVWGLIVPEILSFAVPIATITVLGWWRRVHRDSVPTARWVLAIPALLILPCLAFTRYGSYTDNGSAFVVLVVVSVLLIAASEELMFRGLVVELLRDGLREGWVAMLSTGLFAAMHFLNGAGSLPTVISAGIGGYLYYLTRRAAVILAAAIIAHAAFDFFGFSHFTTDDDAAFNMFVFQLALFIVVLALHRFVPPAAERSRRRVARSTASPAADSSAT
jgi:membrane protease YdiL (CAAX protease family)